MARQIKSNLLLCHCGILLSYLYLYFTTYWSGLRNNFVSFRPVTPLYDDDEDDDDYSVTASNTNFLLLSVLCCVAIIYAI